MPKEFIMRGSTASDTEDKLEFGGQARPGYGYRMTELQIYPSASIGSQNFELMISITADNSAENPQNPDFNNDGLIAVAYLTGRSSDAHMQSSQIGVVNDLFVITQDLILKAIDSYAGAPMACNWQCRFEEVKLSSSAEAVANFKQYSIYNTSQ